MWSAFGLFYLIVLLQNQLNQNIALTEENSSLWKVDDDLRDQIIVFKQQYSLISRSEWGAFPQPDLLNLQLPAERVIIDQTRTEECDTTAKCIFKVRYIQQHHIESLNLSDIGYNFLIGGDGSVYEGTGWNKIGARNKCNTNDSICIAFIGDFKAIKPSQDQLNTAKLLIDDGLRLGKLTSNYKLYAHTQLTPSVSPENELFKLIQKSPHFYGNSNITNDYLLKFVSRSNWIAEPSSDELINLQHPVKLVILSHTATKSCFTQAECKVQVRNIQQFHMESRGFDDIAYNFLVGGDGSIYEGRGWDKVGAHTKGYNNISICIALIGNFHLNQPTSEQLNATLGLIENGVRISKLSFDYEIKGQRQLIPTESPGQILFNIIQNWVHFPHNDSKQLNIDDNHILKIKFISRSEWIAQPPFETAENQVLPIKRIIIAHTATEQCSSQAQCVFRVRFIQTYHMESQGFNDIGYNFLVGGDGAIFEGRGWDKVGAHTKGFNIDSLCIAFIGTFNTVLPSEPQINAAKTLIDYGIKLGKLKPNYELYGHRQLIATSSPGEKLFDEISTWPHFYKNSETQNTTPNYTEYKLKK